MGKAREKYQQNSEGIEEKSGGIDREFALGDLFDLSHDLLLHYSSKDDLTSFFFHRDD